jgi:uncharacterized protein YcbK (DUF882 family)
MVLMPGRNALSFVAPRAPITAMTSVLLLPLLMGMTAQRCFRSLRGESGSVAIASLARVQLPEDLPATASTRRSQAARMPERFGNPDLRPDALATSRTEATLLTTTARFADDASHGFGQRVTFAASMAPSTVGSSELVNVKSVIQAFANRRRGMPSENELAQVPTNGWLKMQALHLGEELNVRPFDDTFHPNPDAFAQIDHALRCRITGNEISIDPRLVAILVQLHSLYGRPVQVVSGHRQPTTIGTKKTSQHALGRAADIRIAGVSIEELKRVAIRFGARGVGLYPEKGFVHLDVRQKNRYYWLYTAAQGEQPDMGMTRPKAAVAVGASATESDSEDSAEGEQDAESESESADGTE